MAIAHQIWSISLALTVVKSIYIWKLSADLNPECVFLLHIASDIESESESLYSGSVLSSASEFKSLPNSRRGSSVNLAASIQVRY